ncbi:MAG: DNA adenine methylase [Clostridia bacterium]|nr:DNA adenine methylase [Clostridia bacterium]
MYSELEKKYKVIYPENDAATYQSLMNFSGDLNKKFQRWFRYKEGYSTKLVERLISEYSNTTKGVILDPFLGSGSTIIAANNLGYSGIGFEVNPFSYFLSKLKLHNYTDVELIEFKESVERLLNGDYENYKESPLPQLSISQNVFNEDIKTLMMMIKSYIKEIRQPVVRDLLLLGWLSIIESVSNYRKAGNGLKKKKYVNPRITTKEDVVESLRLTYQSMIEDITNSNIKFDSQIYNVSNSTMLDYIGKESIDGIIYSPPYANCFDYTEIYKLELWFGDFVNEYSDLKLLRNSSLRSHLNGLLEKGNISSHDVLLNKFIEKIDVDNLWSKKIPSMLAGYFSDMKNILQQSYELLKPGGFCSIVVGNSSYGGVIIPTDLILAKYAEDLGFVVDKIEVDRYIITSSQQYHATKDLGKYLRESVICLQKQK